jgi:hypothetical protein
LHDSACPSACASSDILEDRKRQQEENIYAIGVNEGVQEEMQPLSLGEVLADINKITQ